MKKNKKKLCCPQCGGMGIKAIAFYLPINICSECKTVWGFWGSVYAMIFSQFDKESLKNWGFFLYIGSYFKAVKAFHFHRRNQVCGR